VKRIAPIAFTSDGGMVVITDDGVSYSPPPTPEQRAEMEARWRAVIAANSTPGTITISGTWDADDPDHH
jgi:hypothetical protein